MRSQFLAFACTTCLALGSWTSCSSDVAARTDGGGHDATDAPQDLVVCTGWHALCSASPDCRLHGNTVDCDCLRVNETHIVLTAEIRDADVKQRTAAQCTVGHPCSTDQAPVCGAIRDGRYTVDGVRYDWVSTYSYRGWCELLHLGTRACDPSAVGYIGDTSWAVCDAAPCTENPNPFDSERPLTCQCRVETSPFVGVNNRCTGERGGIISSFPLSAWDFEHNTYTTPMPGYEYVQGACAALRSDPPPPRSNGDR